MKRRKQAKAIQARPSKQAGFPSDAESIAYRQQAAIQEAAAVTPHTPKKGAFYGDFEVASTQWPEPYWVEIRSLTEPLNTCSCQDHRMNGLGTCKHIERVLYVLARGHSRAFQQAARRGAETYEVFFDERTQPPRLRLLRPLAPLPTLAERLEPYFGADDYALGLAPAAWAALAGARAALAPRLRAHLRLSRHAEYWLARARHAAEQHRLEQIFVADVAAGKRSDNPVLLPLYPYQQQGMRHLAFKGRALLADEMGLGKTVQAIAAAELLREAGKVRRVLVVSPASLKAEWEDQLALFTGRQVRPVFGLRPARRQIYSQEHAYTLCNYEQVRQDVDDINRLLVPDLVILDEAQRIKNWPTKTAKTIKRLASPYAFVLTGTPLENRIEELYSLVEFVDPHVFGSLFRFQREYMEWTPGNDIRPRNLEQLHRTVSQVMLRRRKGDVNDPLPERSDKNYFVPLTATQQERYQEFMAEVAKMLAIMKRRPLTRPEFERLQLMLACMRMICDTPYILDAECRDCPKLVELENVLDDVLGDETTKVLIFSEWVRMLDLVKELLEAKGIQYAEHTGRVTQQRRRTEIKRFKEDPACRIFLSSESGGTGLNLQAANVVVNLDLPWNPAKLEQRIARAWRKHQQRTVRVINLVAENTIEQAMLTKLAAKAALADSVLDGVAYEPPPNSAGGRQAFAARLNELLSGETPPKSYGAPQPAAAADRDPVSAFTATHADSILGIERLPDNGACLVVARPDSNLETLRALATAGGPDAPTVVLTPAEKDLLLRMQALGLISLAPQLATLHAADGYQPLAAPKAQPPKLHYAAARAEWKAGHVELRAAQALGEIGLHAQATPHLASALRAGRAALAALYDCPDSADLPPTAAPLHRTLANQIAQPALDPEPDPEHFQKALGWADDLHRLLT